MVMRGSDDQFNLVNNLSQQFKDKSYKISLSNNPAQLNITIS